MSMVNWKYRRFVNEALNTKFNADEVYRNLMPCHKNPILLCHVRNQPEGCPSHCPKLKEEKP